METATCATLDELSTTFEARMTVLRTKLVLRDAIGTTECNAMLEDVESSLSELELVLTVMKTEINKQRKAAQQLQSLKHDVEYLHKRALHATRNLPSHLPSKQQTSDIANTVPPKTPIQRKKQAMYTPLLSGSCQESVQSACSPGVPSVAQIKSKAPTLFIPILEYLTVNEFECVPKYQRGRLTYEHINSSMDEFNTALTAKYKLLAMAKCKQNDRIRKAIWDYKQQENKDTKGMFFITDKDLKSSSRFKMDSAGRIMLTILRHCNRVREVRSKGLVRYAAVI